MYSISFDITEVLLFSMLCKLMSTILITVDLGFASLKVCSRQLIGPQESMTPKRNMKRTLFIQPCPISSLFYFIILWI